MGTRSKTRRRRVRPYAGNRPCQRCGRASAEFRVVADGGPRFLCRLCRDVVEDRPPEVMVHDHERTPETREAEAFVGAQLAPLAPEVLASPLRALYVSLRHSNLAAGVAAVRVDIQARPRGAPRGWRPWMGVDVSVRRTHRYPFSRAIGVGSVAVRDPVGRALIGEDWFLEYEEAVFRDAAEVFAYGAGYGMFKVLRRLRLAPGRASKSGMRAFGLRWLREFRDFRARRAGAPPGAATYQREVS